MLGVDSASWMSVTHASPWEIWRSVTAVFVYPQGQSNLLGFLISLLSFFFVGRAVENFYGPIRFLAIFLVSGIFCNIAYVILALANLGVLAVAFVLALGPVSAIMGIFGAIGVFYLVNRQSLGVSGNGALVSWGFWLLLNLIMVGSISLAAVLAELSCVIVGMILAYLLIPRVNTGRGRL
jgi:membrane associated rhomboid family serine protease